MTDIIIIGAGASGMTAALYALRNGKKVLLIEGNGIGGQIAQSPRVENFPTIPKISGNELADKLFEQITEKGVQFEFGTVQNVTKTQDGFQVVTDFDTYTAKSVIIATGVQHRKLHLPKEEQLIGHGISYCALCDGAFYKGEEVVLIGDGNTALQYALLLANDCKKVHVVIMFDTFFGDKALVDVLEKTPNIQVTKQSKLVELEGDTELTGVTFEKQNGERFTLKTKGLFVAIGQVPKNEIFADLVDISKDGYIEANETCETKTPGLFVCGDCRTKQVRQLTTACGDGAIAGTKASTYCSTLK